MKYFSDGELLKNLLSQLMGGMGTTLSIFFITLAISLPLGLLVAFGRMSKHRWLRAPISFYILIMRGTPLMLQLFAVYFFLPKLIAPLRISRLDATFIAFGINYAAYFAEIFRGGIGAVPKGQYEASQVLGFGKGKTFFRIIFPQVVKHIMLPVSNEVMTLVKDTSLATAIGLGELFLAAKTATSSSASVFPLFLAGLFYLLMNTVVTIVFYALEKKLSYYKV